MMLLTNKQIMRATELGCCVAMGTHDAVVGHAYRTDCQPAVYELGEHPDADLRTYPAFEGFSYVEAVSENGLAFLQLVREV